MPRLQQDEPRRAHLSIPDSPAFALSNFFCLLNRKSSIVKERGLDIQKNVEWWMFKLYQKRSFTGALNNGKIAGVNVMNAKGFILSIADFFFE